MSSFLCEQCGAAILDSPHGYTTGCEHYPLEQRRKVSSSPYAKKLDDMMVRTMAAVDDWDPDDNCEI